MWYELNYVRSDIISLLHRPGGLLSKAENKSRPVNNYQSTKTIQDSVRICVRIKPVVINR